MAEPARKDPVYDDGQSSRPVTRPDLRAMEGGGEGDGIPTGNLHSVKDGETGVGDSDAASPNDLNNAEQGGGLFNPSGDGKKAAKTMGEVTPGATGALVAGSLGGRALKFFTGSATRKRNSIIGTILVAGVTGLGLFGVAQGPFEFIHIAQILQGAHFSDQNNASDDRMGRLFRYLRSGGDVGETRLGYLGSKLKTTMLSQLKDVGFEPIYDNKTGTFKGFVIDTTDENSPYHNMDEGQVRTALANEGITGDVATVSTVDAKITVTPNKSALNSYANKSKLTRFLTSKTKNSIVPQALRDRVFKKYGLVDWHPLRSLKGDVSQGLDIWIQERLKFIKSGAEPTDTITSGSKDQETNAKNQTTTTPGNGSDITGDSPKVSDTLKGIAHGTAGKVTGGVATAIGLLCTLKTVNDNFGDIRYAQYILPMTRLATDAVTVGNQVMDGVDVSSEELNYLSKQFNGPGGNWSNAQTFEADTGQQLTGMDLGSGTKQALSESSPSWLGWIGSVPGIGGLCSTGGQIAAGVVSFTLGIFSGGIASTVLGTVASMGVVGPATTQLEHLLAGNALDVAKLSGADWGNVVNYGARFFANDQAVQAGGTVLTAKQTAELNSLQELQSRAQFASHGIAYRLFNPYDNRSLISALTDRLSPSLTQNVASLSNGFLNIGRSLIGLPGSIFGSIAHAETANNYTWPSSVPQYGFSEEDLNSPLVEDPYANADAVQSLLNSPSSHCLNSDGSVNSSCSYIAKADKCFNVSITKSPGSDGSSYWDVVPGASGDPNALNLYNDNSGSANYYNSSDCAGSGDINWLRLRFFIFDTGVMEGYACYQGDAQSCTNDGF